MTRRLSVACVVVLVACAACGREGAGTADVDPLMQRYRDNVLASTSPVARPGSLTATYLGTSTLLLDDGGTQLLFNPVLSRPVDPSNPKARTDTARIDETIAQLQANRLKGIFVSRPSNRIGDATYIARKTGATLFGPPGVMALARANGLPEAQLAPYDPGATVKVGKFRVQQFASKATPSRQAGGASGPGASSDFLVKKGSRSVLVKSAANFIPGALANVDADVMFLATDHLAEQTPFFQDLYYRQTVGQVRPDLVIPLQWEDTTAPLSRSLEPSEGTPAAFDFLAARLAQDKIRFGLLQGFQTTELFDAKSCAVPVASE